LDSVAKALNSLNEIYHKDAKLATIMTAPTLSTEDKAAIVAELQKHTGSADKADTVKNFLNTLAENNRLGLLKGICEKFGDLMGAARGEVELTVTSASVGSSQCDLQSHSCANHADICLIYSNWTVKHCLDWRQR
jgi:F-type H+-transporting ATPase subunit O